MTLVVEQKVNVNYVTAYLHVTLDVSAGETVSILLPSSFIQVLIAAARMSISCRVPARYKSVCTANSQGA